MKSYLFAGKIYTEYILANKYVIFEYNISDITTGITRLELTDKAEKTVYKIRIYANARYELFTELCKNFNYETTAGDIIKELKGYVTKDEDSSVVKNLHLDINQASEAELTAIPGVTIAKAKHVIKVRNKQKLFLTMNQFYKAIDLNEEFIEQIKFKGTKILLNELPEYKRIEMRDK